MVIIHIVFTGSMAKPHKIKVLFTIPNFNTAGSGKALLKVATHLDPQRFEPHIACMHTKGSFFKEVEKSGIPVHIIPYTIRMKPYHKGLLHCFKISRVFKKINPHLIHSFHYAPDYSEALAARMAGIRWIYTKKNMNWGGKSANGWKLRSFLAHKIVLQNTDMQAEFFPGSKKTVLIPRGVAIKEFTPAAATDALRSQWNLSQNSRILMCVANLVPVKGVEVLIDAFQKNIAAFPAWAMMIVGNDANAYGEELKEKVTAKGLAGKVVFTGKQPNVADYLRLADVFALPTLNQGRKEGSPVAMLEAMASERYVLGSCIPGVKDQLAAFPELLVEAGNTAAWAKALQTAFAKDAAARKSTGAKLRAAVIARYSLKHEVAKCEKLYQQIAAI
jgi:glycosyltransferase involved in cell wall biosynthesis